MDNVNKENEIILSRDDFKVAEMVMRRFEIMELQDLKNPTCLIGEEVESKTYGKGVLLTFNKKERFFEIKFINGESKLFLFPEAFQLDLKFVDGDIQRKIEELMEGKHNRLEEYRLKYKQNERPCNPIIDTEHSNPIIVTEHNQIIKTEMKEPLMEDFGLTQEDIEKYNEQLDKKYKARSMAIDIKSNNYKVALFVLLALSVIIGIILAATHSENSFLWLMSPFVVLGIPMFICHAMKEDCTLSYWKERELDCIVDRDLKRKNEDYENALREYERYLQRCSIDFWRSLDGFTFEKEVAKLFTKQGYNAIVTSATGDGGVDIILTNDCERIAVQCKHHSKPVGPNDVRALQGVVASRNYSKGIFVSLNGYTSTVYGEVRSGNVEVELLALKDILKMAK